MILPPKRFESVDDAKYDPIRFYPWFWKLEQRRSMLPFLQSAAMDMQLNGLTLANTATVWGVERHELGKYVDFVAGVGQVCHLDQKARNVTQLALDTAYDLYCRKNGQESFQKCITDTNFMFNLSAKKLIELWETDPLFYPTVYQRKFPCLTKSNSCPKTGQNSLGASAHASSGSISPSPTANGPSSLSSGR